MTITLWRGRDAWHATHTGEGADEIRRLFGTATLPTAFLPAMPAEQVRAEIAALNPGARIEVR